MSAQSEVAKIEKQRAKDKNARILTRLEKDAKSKIADLNNQLDSLIALQEQLKADSKAQEKTLAALTSAYNSQYRIFAPGGISLSEQAILDELYAPIKLVNNTINANTAKIEDLNAKIKKIKAQLNQPIPGTSANKKNTLPSVATANSSGGKVDLTGGWKYNAPMVKHAYFGTNIQNDVLDGNLVDAGVYDDAAKAWNGVTGGRGTIQMDRKYITSITESQSSEQGDFDPQLYGFKFLYNPQTVSMAWGQLTAMDPTFEAAGQDAFSVISAQLMSATIRFDLLLNRTADTKYLNEDGSIKGNVFTPGDGFYPVETYQNYPYPNPVSEEDRKEIYRKGTMYDLEYLFKTINGPNAQFTSGLNGPTADHGWIRPTMVELHLGQAMRYRVRVVDLSVNHVMFNNRMVPILSNVSITVARFNDGKTLPEGNFSGSSVSVQGGTKNSPHQTGMQKGLL